MNTKKGFTLIELLVVIAIIGILSSVVLASLNSARVKSRDARRISDIKQLQLAMELYFDSNGAYPATIELVAPDFIAQVPAGPSALETYSYASDGTTYVLQADLEQLDHQSLNGDIDGTITLNTVAVDCADEVEGYYCVQP